MEVKERLHVETTPDKFQAALHKQRFDFALKHLKPSDSVLEVGTGLGSFSVVLESYCQEYTGLEFDAQSASLTRQRLTGKGRVVQGDARKMPFPARSFDSVVCLEVLEHLGEWELGVNGVRNCLKQDGVAVISVPYRTRGGPSPGNVYHLYEPSEAELVASLRRHFADVSVYYQYFPENSAMTMARKLHLRRVLGLDAPYRALSAGEPEAVNHLRIEPQCRGFGLHLVVVARRPVSAP